MDRVRPNPRLGIYLDMHVVFLSLSVSIYISLSCTVSIFNWMRCAKEVRNRPRRGGAYGHSQKYIHAHTHIHYIYICVRVLSVLMFVCIT